jgi:hypothetical protein
LAFYGESGLDEQQCKDAVMVRVANNGRLLGLDLGDWSMLLAGSALAGLFALLL